MIELFKNILDYMEQHQFITTIFISGGVSVLFNLLAQIKINKEAEKAKYEMQRKYMHTAVKTKNLLVIYPKLYELMLEAGGIVNVIDVINKKEKQLVNNPPELKKVIIEFINEFIDRDDTYGLNNIVNFVNYYEKSLLFISGDITKIVQEQKTQFHELYIIVKDVLTDSNYKEFDIDKIIALIRKADPIIVNINELKNKMQKQMHKELHPL
jgi:hypothetical protein